MTLISRTVRTLPDADIDVRAAWFSGLVCARCIDNPMYDWLWDTSEGIWGIEELDRPGLARRSDAYITAKCGKRSAPVEPENSKITVETK